MQIKSIIIIKACRSQAREWPPGPVTTQLIQKYDSKFNFFFAKPIGDIVYNLTYAPSTLDFKDSLVYSESSEYLKRCYHIKNQAGRNEIYDRIQMLADFYSGVVMLKYEHPLMIVSNTKNIFIKRLKRMKKMIASDCSSQESSEHGSARSSQARSFSSSRFLKSIRTSQLEHSSGENSLIGGRHGGEKSYDEEVHDIYPRGEEPAEQVRGLVLAKEEKQVAHLIVDVDDVDKNAAIALMRKLQEREPVAQQKKPQSNPKKSSIIITPIDDNPFADQQSESSAHYHHYKPRNSGSKMMKKQSPAQRYNRVEYNETIRLGNYYNHGAALGGQNQLRNVKHSAANRSPSFGHGPDYLQGGDTQRNTRADHYRHQPISADPRRISRQAMARQSRDRLFTHNSNMEHNPQQLHLMPRQQHSTLYLTQENSVSQVSSKAQHKQYIREKAVALLHKARSEQRLTLVRDYDQMGRGITRRYQQQHGLLSYQ